MLTVDVDDTRPIVGAHTTRAHLPPEKRDKWSPSCDSGRKIPVSFKYVLVATVLLTKLCLYYTNSTAVSLNHGIEKHFQFCWRQFTFSYFLLSTTAKACYLSVGGGSCLLTPNLSVVKDDDEDVDVIIDEDEDKLDI